MDAVTAEGLITDGESRYGADRKKYSIKSSLSGFRGAMPVFVLNMHRVMCMVCCWMFCG
jgi:hypothetical protein